MKTWVSSSFFLVTALFASLLLPAAGRCELIFHVQIKELPQIITPADPVVIRATLINDSNSTENLGVIGGFQMNPPGFDYEIGAFANCGGYGYTLVWGPDGSLQNQFEGVNLLPGESFDFVFYTCTPDNGGAALGTHNLYAELQLFAAAPGRPRVGSASDSIVWTVVNATPTPTPTATPTPVSTDSISPVVIAIPAGGKAGRTIKLPYLVSDNSNVSRETVRVYSKETVLTTLTNNFAAIPRLHLRSVSYNSAGRSRGVHKFCVSSEDRAGNVSRQSCAPLLLH